MIVRERERKDGGWGGECWRKEYIERSIVPPVLNKETRLIFIVLEFRSLQVRDMFVEELGRLVRYMWENDETENQQSHATQRDKTKL